MAKPLIRFLSLALASSALVFASGRAPIVLAETPLLFVDDSGLLTREGVVRTFHSARTQASPVIQADRPWEGDRVYVYGSIHRESPDGRFLLWYQANSAAAESAALAPQLRRGGKNLVLLATSVDGVTWEKPALGLHTYDGSSANNIVFDAQSPAVVHDTFERDPSRRYKMLTYFRGGYLAAFSPDGRRWTEPMSKPVFTGDDTMSLTQDPRTGEFLAYFKHPDERVPGRLVYLTRSRDFLHWSEPRLVFHADAEDNRWASLPDQRTEVYSMAVVPHASGFLGFPALFRVVSRQEKGVKRPPGQSGHDGPIDVQFVTSVDGEHWSRTEPRTLAIPRGAPGSFDGGAILGVSSTCIHDADATWMLYTALNTGHGAPIPPKRITIGRAEWRLHGFASLDGGATPGLVETRPLSFAQPGLILNADASQGRVRVAVLEADGRPLPGRGLVDCEPLRSDKTATPVRWRKGSAIPADRPVRLQIELAQARLFSVSSGRVDAPTDSR